MCKCEKWVNGIPSKPGFYLIRNNVYERVVAFFCDKDDGDVLSVDLFYVFDSLTERPKRVDKNMLQTWGEFTESMQYKTIGEV